MPICCIYNRATKHKHISQFLNSSQAQQNDGSEALATVVGPFLSWACLNRVSVVEAQVEERDVGVEGWASQWLQWLQWSICVWLLGSLGCAAGEHFINEEQNGSEKGVVCATVPSSSVGLRH